MEQLNLKAYCYNPRDLLILETQCVSLIRDLSYQLRDYRLEYEEALANINIIGYMADALNSLIEAANLPCDDMAIRQVYMKLSEFLYKHPEYKGYFSESALISKETLQHLKLLEGKHE